jgi:hypothetical protein
MPAEKLAATSKLSLPIQMASKTSSTNNNSKPSLLETALLKMKLKNQQQQQEDPLRVSPLKKSPQKEAFKNINNKKEEVNTFLID